MGGPFFVGYNIRMQDLHASIDKAGNGYVLYLRIKNMKEDAWPENESYIYPTLDEALKHIDRYFHE